MRRALAAVGFALFLVRPFAAQSPDGDRSPKRVTGPPVEFPEVFTVIRAVMALPDGRLVVSDPQDNKVLLIDFAEGTRRELGRAGAGPQEFRRTGGLYRAKGGGVLIFDQGLRRLLPVTVSAQLLDVVALPIPGSSSAHSNRGPDSYVPDSLGNGYGAVRFGRDFAATSYPFVRYRREGRADTVTRLLKPRNKVIESTANTSRSVEIFFSPQDAWVVAPDGRIAVVRAAPYRVEWFPLNGPAVIGPVIAHAAIKVTQADKDATTARVGQLGGRQNVNLGVNPGTDRPPPAAPPAGVRGELLFADVKPPVKIDFGHWPLLDETGRLWVERNLPAGATTTVWDVFDRGGNLVDRIELPATSRLIGFDARWLYTVRVDADDFEHLQRFPLPR